MRFLFGGRIWDVFVDGDLSPVRMGKSRPEVTLGRGKPLDVVGIMLSTASSEEIAVGFDWRCAVSEVVSLQVCVLSLRYATK